MYSKRILKNAVFSSVLEKYNLWAVMYGRSACNVNSVAALREWYVSLIQLLLYSHIIPGIHGYFI